MHRLDGHDRKMQRQQRAVEPAKCARDDESDKTNPCHVDSGGTCARFAFTHALDNGTEGRGKNTGERKERNDDEGSYDVIMHKRVNEIEMKSEQVDCLHINTGEAVLAAGPIGRFVEQIVEALRERERYHCEIDAE